MQLAGSALGVLLLVAGVFFLVRMTTGGNDKTPTASSSSTTCHYTSSGAATKPTELPPSTPEKGNFTATLVTSAGVVQMDLFSAAAPCTVNSFRALATSGYYDETPCHRLVVEPDFGVLQCGDPSGQGSGGPGYTFPDENLAGATYPRGTVAMANSGPNTNGSQFFLVFKDTQLDPNYTPFGRITKGLDVLDKIAKVGLTTGPTGDGSPKQPVKLIKVSVAAS